MKVEQERLEHERREIETVILSEEQEAQIDEAMRHASDPEDEEVAISASFDLRNRMLLLELKTGQRLAIPQEDLQDLYDADPEDLVDVEILRPGTALHWERLMEGAEAAWNLRKPTMDGWTRATKARKTATRQLNWLPNLFGLAVVEPRG